MFWLNDILVPATLTCYTIFYIVVCPVSFDSHGAILIKTNFEGSCKCTRTLQRAAPSPVSVKETAASNAVIVSFIVNLTVPVYIKYWQSKIRNLNVLYNIVQNRGRQRNSASHATSHILLQTTDTDHLHRDNYQTGAPLLKTPATHHLRSCHMSPTYEGTTLHRTRTLRAPEH